MSVMSVQELAGPCDPARDAHSPAAAGGWGGLGGDDTSGPAADPAGSGRRRRGPSGRGSPAVPRAYEAGGGPQGGDAHSAADAAASGVAGPERSEGRVGAAGRLPPDWLEGRGPRCVRMAFIAEARRPVGARFDA